MRFSYTAGLGEGLAAQRGCITLRAMDQNWTVYPHGKLQEITPGLWQVTGSLPSGHVPRNMAVYRLPDRGLLLHSVMCLDEGEMARLESLGQPSVMIVPNGWHRLDAARYKRRFPGLRVICPAAARPRAAKVVPVDATMGAATDTPISGVTAHLPPGCTAAERVYEVSLQAGSALLMCDLMMNLPLKLPGMDGFIFRLLGSTGFFGTTRIGRLLLVKDRRTFSCWLRTMADRDIRAISVAHGEAITERCGERLRAAAQRLE